MANVITLNSPQPMEYVQHFLDSYQQNRARRSAEDLQRQQLDLERQKTAQQGQYQSGMLKNDTSRSDLETQKYQDASLDGDVLSFLKTAVEPYIASGRPEDAMTAQKNVRDMIAAHPEFEDKLRATAMRLQNQTPQDATNANVGQFSAAQTAAAAGGSTDPNATAFTWQKATGKDIPSYAFVQQQAADLQSRNQTGAPGTTPNAKSGIPQPSGNAVSDFEARATEAMPTSAQNQVAKTAVTTTGMGETGATERTRLQTASAERIAATKAQAKPVAPAGVVDGVLQDPQSYFGLPMDDKKAVLAGIGRAPSKLSAAEVERLNAANLGRQIIDDADTIVKKWQQRGAPITGSVLGRFNAAEGKWGDLILPNFLSTMPNEQRTEYAQDIAQLREWLTALPVQEAKALAGGRTAYQVIQAITSTAPSLSKSADMFEGSVKGLRTRFDQIGETIDKKQWGGVPPAGYKTARERSAAVVAPPAGAPSPAAASYLKSIGH